MTSPIARDERERSIDLAADRLAFLVVCYGALALAAYRSFVLGQQTWDLLGLVVLGGIAGLAYRVQKRVVGRSWTLVLVATIVVAAIVAAAAGLVAGAR
jgi:hypothetical protein